MKFTQESAALVLLAGLSQAAIITTTLSPGAQSSVAAVEQQDPLGGLILEIFQSTTMLNFLNGNYPPGLMSFMGDVFNYDGDDFPTSLFANNFPWGEFETLLSNAPWKEDYLSQAGVEDIYPPSHYAVMTITNDEPESTTATSEKPAPTQTQTTVFSTTEAPTTTTPTTSAEPATSSTTSAEPTTSTTSAESSEEETTAAPSTIPESTSSAMQTPVTSEYSDVANGLAVPGTLALLALAFL